MDDIRYPIGPFVRPDRPLTAAERNDAIEAIAATPARLRAAVSGLTDEQLDTSYRPDSWSVRQLVHHLPDSHLNAYIRFKWTLAETQPAIKTYDQDRWAELPEARTAPPELSLSLLEALHARWVVVLRSMAPADWERTLLHPESGPWRLDQLLALYAWHGPHHVGHVTKLRERQGW